MAENDNPEATPAPEAAATDATGQAPRFAIQKLYLKDVSFEAPGAPAIFQESGDPELKLNLQQRVQPVGEDLYEVVLTVTVTCTLGEKTAYLAEVQQAGVFGLNGFAQDQLQATLGAYCPTILFPYARQQVSDLVAHGGFQPLILQPVNFDQLYADQVRKRMEQGEAAGSA
ncbi:MAG: protein-export chaperone SecB [Xanthomonadales bacterium]|nr:protein-export chaperone SecB [Xanthomonadales bacterium]